jgi:hypothetical protein
MRVSGHIHDERLFGGRLDLTMDESELDTRLRQSRPRVDADAATSVTLRAMVAGARDDAQPIRKRRRRLWLAAIPAVPALAFALTAGVEARLAPDLTIPVHYVTDTGVQVSCSIFLFNGEIYWQEVSFSELNYLRKQNWAGVGERIYQDALIQDSKLSRAAAEVPPSPIVRQADGTAPDERTIERMAWSLAESDIVKVPESDMSYGGYGGDSDCSGQLH